MLSFLAICGIVLGLWLLNNWLQRPMNDLLDGRGVEDGSGRKAFGTEAIDSEGFARSLNHHRQDRRFGHLPSKELKAMNF